VRRTRVGMTLLSYDSSAILEVLQYGLFELAHSWQTTFTRQGGLWKPAKLLADQRGTMVQPLKKTVGPLR
jgi:hypothetical protein